MTLLEPGSRTTDRPSRGRAAGPLRVRVGLAGSSELVRHGLAAVLERHHELHAGCVVVDLRNAAPADVDVALVDTGALGPRATDRIHDLVVAGFEPVLALGWEPAWREEFLAAGARGYLSMRLAAADLVEALVRAAQVSPPAQRHRCPQDPPGGFAFEAAGCSRREAEVVRLICSGLSNEEIARELFVSINTVKTYIRSAYRKIGVATRTEAVIWGAQRGVGRPAGRVPVPHGAVARTGPAGTASSAGQA